jgi:hypothetical protein
MSPPDNWHWSDDAPATGCLIVVAIAVTLAALLAALLAV